MNAISLKDVWLKYRVEFKEDGRLIPEDFWALKEINMDVAKGEAICIIGENGSGKTTLLKIVARMLKPDRGIVEVNGTVSALIEIGAGFQKDLTGKENVYLTSSFFGLTKEQIDARYSDIVKFASIGRFIDAPVKNYSQGMYMRLAFAIAIHVEPEILLVDDMFVVGDLYAQRKCINKMLELKEKGKTLIFVTHDIEMAKRFCQRGILLKDGRVIKDGMLKETISYYLKAVGDKRGVGILQGEHLGLIFNNGKLILNWDEESITKEWAGHTSILSGGNLYSSLQADWELKESSPDRIVLEGKCWDLPVSQLWDIKLDDRENEIDLKIEMGIEERFDFQECRLCFMFRENYKYWFNPFKKERFALDDLSSELSWKCINSENPAVNFIGLSMTDKSEVFLPSVMLEDEVYLPGKLLEIYNTDKGFQARTLQSKITFKDINIETGRHLFFHAKIRFIKDPAAENNFRQNVLKTMLPKIIGDKDNLSLSIDDNKKISLYWRNKKITASKGFQTTFYYNGRIYHSSDATICKIHKVNDRRLNFIIQWPDYPIRQIWNIELLEEIIVLWKVHMEISRRAVVRNNAFNVMFSPQYTKWVTSDQEGDVTEELNTQDFKNIIMRNDPYGIIGLKGILSNNSELPYVLLCDVSSYTKFNSVEKKIDRNTDVSADLDNAESVINLFVLNADSKESIDFLKGLYLVCDVRILIGEELAQKKYIEDIKQEKRQKLVALRKETICVSEAIIENGQFKFSFIKGRGRLFFKDREITKNFGVYTSLNSNEFNEGGLWYASLDAIWEIISYRRKRLVVRGKWPYLPVIQIWEIKPSHNGFIWKVDMEVYASMHIERQQANIMVSDNYENWSVFGRQSGSFPEEFALLRWDSLYRERGVDRLNISVKKDSTFANFPNLCFSCNQEVNNFEAIIENSNVTFNSRILGFERVINKDNEVLLPGIYKYFHGAISFPTNVI